MRFVGDEFDGIPESYDDYKKMIYSGFPSEKVKLDAVFADLDKIDDLMGEMDKPHALSLQWAKIFNGDAALYSKRSQANEIG